MDRLILPLLFSMGLSLGLCLPEPPPIEKVPRETWKCADACKHLRDLGCPEGQPLADGTSCTTWCEKTERAGMPVGVQCIVAAPDCNSIYTCERPRRFE